MVNEGVETWGYILRQCQVCMICRSSFLLFGKKRKKFYLLSFKSYLSCNETRSAIRKHAKRGGVLNSLVGTLNYYKNFQLLC
jgi:hypothetical protein